LQLLLLCYQLLLPLVVVIATAVVIAAVQLNEVGASKGFICLCLPLYVKLIITQ
jgi:Mg2+/citrate symporter